MNQIEFTKVKEGDYVLTVYKGHVVKMRVLSIYDKGHRCRNVNLAVPDSNRAILRHMYGIYELKES